MLEMQNPSPSAKGQKSCFAPSSVQLISLLLGVLGLIGFVLAQSVAALEMHDTFHSRSDNMFYYLFVIFDRWHFILFSVLCGFSAVWLDKKPVVERKDQLLTRPHLFLIATGVVILCALGTHFVFLNYPFAMDEYYSDFQAAIFAEGKLFANLPFDSASINQAASPLMVNYNPAAQTWTSNYLPVYALLRTPFWMAHCSWLLNPLLAGLTVLAMVGVVQRLWPEEPRLRWFAVVLLVSNVQFLITGMTAYAMSAHLLANLFWLWLYLDPSPKKQMQAPLLGVLAMGLHQPNVHLLFAFPFCVKLVLDRRWKMATWHLLVYGAGLWLWLQFMDYKSPPPLAEKVQQASSALAFIAKTFFTKLPNSTQVLDSAIGWAKALVWAPVAVIIFAVVALTHWKKRDALQVCLLSGILLALIVVLLFPLNQGHGWGNRYLMPYLGNITLLAVAGFRTLEFRRDGYKILALSTLVSVCISLPLRAWEARSVVTPFASASRAMQSLPYQYVIIDTKTMWYGQDFVRNEPGLGNTPKFLFINRYTAEVEKFCQEHPPSGRVGFNHLQRFGILPRFVPPPPPKVD